MSDANVYVDTDVIGGAGDGTSWANAYATLVLAEAGKQAELDKTMIIHCRGVTNPDDMDMDFDGWTTTDAWRIVVQVDNADDDKHEGLYSATKYRLASQAHWDEFILTEDYCEVYGLQFHHGNHAGKCVWWKGTGDFHFSYNIIVPSTYNNAADYALYFGVQADFEITNNICYIVDYGYGLHLHVSEEDSGLLANNTVDVGAACVYGIGSTALLTDTQVSNNIVQGAAGTNFSFGNNPGIMTYNISEDDTADDFGGSNNVASHAIAFVNQSVDYHLHADEDGQHEGVDLSGTFNGDIDSSGITRTDWDIGADEIAGGLSIPIASYNYKNSA